jgi:hypothetical protein
VTEVPATGIGQHRDGPTEQIRQQFTAVTEVPDALVLGELGQVVVCPAVRLELHARVLHLEHLVERQGAQRLRAGSVDPVDGLTRLGQRLRHQEHCGR